MIRRRLLALLITPALVASIAIMLVVMGPRASTVQVRTAGSAPQTSSEPPAPAPTTATSFTGSADQLPDCIPVDSRSTSDVGCELKSDFEAIAPDPSQPGIPVYDDKGTAPGPIVGYVDDEIGQFVPIAIARDPASLEKLRACNTELLRGARLDDDCQAALEAIGTPPRVLSPTTTDRDTPSTNEAG
jgi:hypothetical protein